MIRIWRHLHLLKRGGRGHSPGGAAGTAPGELAVLCPACPYPDINLPTDWKSVPKSSEYVWACLFVLVTHASPDISITRVSALMRVSGSNGARSPATRRTLSLAPGLHMS